MDVCLLWVLYAVLVEVSATSWWLVQRSPTDCGASLCVKNEEAKARYRAVKIQPQWVVTAGKQTNKQNIFWKSARWRTPTLSIGLMEYLLYKPSWSHCEKRNSSFIEDTEGILDYRHCIIMLIAVTFNEGFLDKNLEKGMNILSGWKRSTVQIQNTCARKCVNEER
jgi:hypothetical protein